MQRRKKDKIRERNGEKIACDNCGAIMRRKSLEQHKMSFKSNCKQVDPKDVDLDKVKR